MILTAHQPAYLPWLGLFHKIECADAYVYFDDVQYSPKDWQNRNKIKVGDEVIWLTVPVRKSGHRDKTIRDIPINNDRPWRRKHWRSIMLNYRSAPYWDEYKDFLEETYEHEWEYLVDLNEHFLKWFLDEFGIDTKFLTMSNYDFHGEKSELVLDMCTTLGADVYIYGEKGKNYADVEAFLKAGVEPVFQEYDHPKYPQLHGEFESHLSALDLLLNCGPDSYDIIMGGQDPLPGGELERYRKEEPPSVGSYD